MAHLSLTLYVLGEPLTDGRQCHCPVVPHNYVHRHREPTIGEED
jgi:hypothetical protein